MSRRELMDETDDDPVRGPGLPFAPETLIQRLAARTLACRGLEVDEFGYDPVSHDKAQPLLRWLFDSYWRVRIRGQEHLPERGPFIVVANHGGVLPWDALMLKLAAERTRPDTAPVRFLMEDFVFHFPFLGALLTRLGGARAHPDNARRLLGRGAPLLVFPEGDKGLGKLYRNRHQLQRFGRGGFLKLALREGVPLVPAALVGPDEIHPVVARLRWLARPLGLPYLPVTLTFPALGPLGLLPLPVRWSIAFGEPLRWERDAIDPGDAVRVAAQAERVREKIQQMVNDLLDERARAGR
jgi:1-acyl-sn-glycerol-3-phosphate acyltransferase